MPFFSNPADVHNFKCFVDIEGSFLFKIHKARSYCYMAFIQSSCKYVRCTSSTWDWCSTWMVVRWRSIDIAGWSPETICVYSFSSWSLSWQYSIICVTFVGFEVFICTGGALNLAKELFARTELFWTWRRGLIADQAQPGIWSFSSVLQKSQNVLLATKIPALDGLWAYIFELELFFFQIQLVGDRYFLEYTRVFLWNVPKPRFTRRVARYC